MSTMFDVTSVLNRQSIMAHGLDWNRMGASPGIAGSTEAEEAGVFLCPDSATADFFVRVNNAGGPVDVWVVMGIDSEQLVTTGSGFDYFPDRIPLEQLRLLHRDVVAAAYRESPTADLTATAAISPSRSMTGRCWETMTLANSFGGAHRFVSVRQTSSRTMPRELRAFGLGRRPVRVDWPAGARWQWKLMPTLLCDGV